MPIGETMSANKREHKAFDAIYFMTLSLASFVVPVILYRNVDETSAIIAWGVIVFLILDFYLRHKLREVKKKKYLALKKEEKAILAEFRTTRR